MTEHTEHKHPSLATYFTVFALLMILTAVTVWVAYHDWGVFNNVIAMAIATFKATIVILFFMHIRYEKPLLGAFVVVGILWLLLLVGIVVLDVYARSHFF